MSTSYLVETAPGDGTDFNLRVTENGVLLGEAGPFQLPDAVMGRFETFRIWKTLRGAADKIAGTEDRQDQRRSTILGALRIEYWAQVGRANGMPKGWLCLTYVPGFLGGLCCDTEYAQTPAFHLWSSERCSRQRLDLKTGDRVCLGRRPDKWVASDV